MIKRYILFVVAIVLTANIAIGRSTGWHHYNVDASRQQQAQAWADSVLSTLTLRQQIGQLIFPRLDIKNDAAGRAALKRMIDNVQIGGFLLGKGTLADYRGLIEYGQSLSRVPLMVTLDGEWGLAMRVSDAPRFPYNMALGAIQDKSLLEEYGREVARECRAVGINVNFAPVLDVNSNPDNPVIGYRSYGEDPARVADLGVAYSKGLESAGVMSVSKHFPGHGDTSTDSHKTLPTISHSAVRINQVDLVPFKRYIEAGLSGVMVGHLNIPAYDPSGTPASLSQIITTDLLKKRLGFGGLVWTDALAMEGATTRGNICVAALKAGADVLLQPRDPAKDLEAVLEAVKQGKISADVIKERCSKVLAYKYMFGCGLPPTGLVADVNAPQATTINQKLCDAAITLLKDRDGVIPIKKLQDSDVVVVTLGAKGNNTFTKTCKRYTNCETVTAEDGNLTAAQMAKIQDGNTVIVAIFKQSLAVKASLDKIARLRDTETTAVCFVNPYKMAKMQTAFEHFDALITAYDDTPLLQQSAAEAVFGGIACSGRLPVNLKGWLKMGTGIDTQKTRLGFSTPQAEGLPANLATIYSNIIDKAIADGAFPGCQVLVAKNGNIVLDRTYGSLNPGGTKPVTEETIYDVASVSKVAGTLSAVMRAYDKHKFKLDDPIEKFLPELKGTDKGAITMRQLLLHQSGMPAMLTMYKMMLDTTTFTGPAVKAKKEGPYTIRLDKNLYANKDARLRRDIISDHPTDLLPTAAAEGIYVGQSTYDSIMARIYNVDLRKPAYRYSDLNFALLMEVVERIDGRRLDTIVEDDVFAPLGADNTMYLPLEKGVAASRIAPTERDNFLRRQLLQGYVHDEMAAFMGGVAGNAGLFTTANDLAKLAQTWLNGGEYGGERIFKQSTLREFTTTRSADGRRALGFDTAPGRSGAGSKNAYGHTGFTGTQVKVDPDNNLIFIFLSNRVNPTRDNPAFTRSDIRNRLFTALFEQ